jgi:hypothetical protein
MPDEETEEEDENGYGVSLLGYQEEPFDLAVTTLLGHRIAHLIRNVEDRDKHNKLMADLIAHVWTKT